ncbi:hypothetical protein DRQ12_05225 [candidate division KSB1 bacterium]|nr:MAG: hypothetical protein DRQ12_05225 [candidate division KSB1 bacterium]
MTFVLRFFNNLCFSPIFPKTARMGELVMVENAFTKLFEENFRIMINTACKAQIPVEIEI